MSMLHRKTGHTIKIPQLPTTAVHYRWGKKRKSKKKPQNPPPTLLLDSHLIWVHNPSISKRRPIVYK